MKLRSLLAPVTLSAALFSPSAFSGYVVSGGDITLSESGDIQSSLDILGISNQVQVGGGTQISYTYDPVSSYNLPSLTARLTDVKHANGIVRSVSSKDFVFQLTRQTPGGTSVVGIKNLQFDVTNRTVFADIYTQQGSFLHQSFLVPTSTTQATGWADTSPKDYWQSTPAFEGKLTNLSLGGTFDAQTHQPTGFVGILAQGLSLSNVSANALNGYVFGDISFVAHGWYQFPNEYYPNYPNSFYETPAVPEPSAYVLLAAGIASLGVMSQCKRRSAARSN